METGKYEALIPKKVLFDPNLTAGAKLLYGNLVVISEGVGTCTATNTFLAHIFKVSYPTISKWITNLTENGYIECQMIYGKGENRHGYRRVIKLVEEIL